MTSLSALTVFVGRGLLGRSVAARAVASNTCLTQTSKPAYRTNTGNDLAFY